MFLDKLQSGFLLLETRQGLVRVDVSPRQRIYLLWTFRNFHHLSVPLLNACQAALINSLFYSGVPCDRYDPGLVIGVVDNFTSPPPLVASVQEETLRTQRAEVSAPILLPSPKAGWLKTTASVAGAKLAPTRIAAAAAALCLCVISVMAWHRIQGIPVSQAHDRPALQQISAAVQTGSQAAAYRETGRAPSQHAGVERAEPKVVESSSGSVEPFATASPGVPPGAALGADDQRVPLRGIPAHRETGRAPSLHMEPETTAEEVRGDRPLAAAVPTTVKRRVRSQNISPRLPLSNLETGILASRPPLHFEYPDYPEVHARGVVSLTAMLDSEGAVRAVKVISGNRALAGAAVRAIRRWRYRPYLKDGEPVATETNIVISFLSEDAISMSYPPSLLANR